MYIYIYIYIYILASSTTYLIEPKYALIGTEELIGSQIFISDGFHRVIMFSCGSFSVSLFFRISC